MTFYGGFSGNTHKKTGDDRMPKKKQNTYQNVDYIDFEIRYHKELAFEEEALHEHDFFELCYFQRGDVTWLVEGRRYIPLPGDILLLSPGEKHCTLTNPGNTIYEHITLRIAKDFMEQFQIGSLHLAQCFDISAAEHANRLRMPAPQRQRIKNGLQDLMTESFFTSNEAFLAKTCILATILVGVNLMYTSSGCLPQTARPSGLVLSNVVNYINEHYMESLTIEDLSSRFFISKNHLQREFKHVYGTSVHQFIIQKRANVARDLMTDGVPPTEVYLQCGFGDYSNFFRVFKKEYDLSPVEYFNEAKKSREGLQ